MACEILVPWPGIEPMPLAFEEQSLNQWTPREVPLSSLSIAVLTNVEIISHCSFMFPWWCWTPFLWKKISVQIHHPFFFVFVFACYCCMNSLYILCNNPLSDIVCEHFSPILLVSFSLCWLFLLLCRCFLVWFSPTFFLPFFLVFLVSLPRPVLKSVFAIFSSRSFRPYISL